MTCLSSHKLIRCTKQCSRRALLYTVLVGSIIVGGCFHAYLDNPLIAAFRGTLIVPRCTNSTLKSPTLKSVDLIRIVEEETKEWIAVQEAKRDKLIHEIGGVPFYIYDFEDGVEWQTDLHRILNTDFCLNVPRHFAYRGEVFFLQQLQHHSWRTYNKTKAQVLILPIFAHVAEHGHCQYTPENVDKVMDVIVQSPTFQERPNDHLLVWTSPMAQWKPLRYKWMEDINIAYYENNREPDKNRPSIVAPYSTDRGDDDDDGLLSIPLDQQVRDITVFFGSGRIGDPEDPRDGYYVRESLVHQMCHAPSSSTQQEQLLFVTISDMCDDFPDCNETTTSGMCRGSYVVEDVLPRSKFVLDIRGDVRSSPRYAEGLMYGSIPIFVADQVFRTAVPFQCFVPWNEFVLQIPEVDFMCNATAALTSVIASQSETEIHRKRLLMRHYRRDVLWRANNSRVAENILLSATTHRRTVGRCLLFPDRLSRSKEERPELFGLDEDCRGVEECCAKQEQQKRWYNGV